MAQHLKTGKQGEALALSYLQKKGYEILATNWKHRRAEIDIIAKDQKILVFVEVKTRRDDYFGKPEVAVTKRKKTLLTDASIAYMEEIQHDWEIRFDIISIVARTENDVELVHFEDAFFPGLA